MLRFLQIIEERIITIKKTSTESLDIEGFIDILPVRLKVIQNQKVTDTGNLNS